jgi:hypothetical protein
MSFLIQIYIEHFANGGLPKNLWAYLASVLMYLFHKKLPEERLILSKHGIQLVMLGSVLARFSYRVVVRMKRMAVAKQLLLSHQFPSASSRMASNVENQPVLANVGSRLEKCLHLLF